MRCRDCPQPIERCHRPRCWCTGWRHAGGTHLSDWASPHLAAPAAIHLDATEAIDGPGYEWRRELAAEWGGPTNAAGSGFVPAQPLPAVTQGGNP